MRTRFAQPEMTTDPAASFMTMVYGWMALGLGVTALVAAATVSSAAIMNELSAQPLLLLGIFIIQLILVFVLSARVNTLAPAAASGLFILYAALTGVTFSVVLLVYTGASVAAAFVVAAGMFGIMALIGATTRKRLSGVGTFCSMALIGLILASLVGLFWHNAALQFGIAVVGVIVFAGLTAWDTQRLEEMALAGTGNDDRAYAIVGALALYLDLINLFLSLLRLIGRRRQ